MLGNSEEQQHCPNIKSNDHSTEEINPFKQPTQSTHQRLGGTSTMATLQEKVYIVVGKDIQQGNELIRWALSNWTTQQVTFVILQVTIKSKNFVYTPIGILPISSVNEEMLDSLRAREQESVNKISRKYMALCSKVKAEVIKIERFDEQLDKIILGLISNLEIKKLVMSATTTKSLSWKNKYDIAVPHSVYKLKPEHCELFVVCREKLLFFREENDEVIHVEDEDGVVVTDLRKLSKEKGGLKVFLGKIFTDDTSSNYHDAPSAQMSSNPTSLKDQFEEVEKYISYLQTMYKLDGDEDEDTMPIAQCQSKESATDAEKENLRTSCPPSKELVAAKIKEAEKTVEEKQKEAKAEAERRSKAEWAISVCNQKDAEIEGQLNEEIAKESHLKEGLEVVRRQASELSDEIMESKNKLKAAIQLENELRIRLEEFSSEKSRVQKELENVTREITEMERKTEAVRRKRDMLRRNIDQWKHREISKLWLQTHYREFSAGEVDEATGGFSDDMKIGADNESIVYKAKICHIDVAIKFSTEFSTMSQEQFRAEVDLLSRIRHPNILHVIGACEERRCVVFEFASNGSVRDALFAATPLDFLWHSRIRVAAEIASVVGFLHAAGHAHGRLRASCVLLDRHLSAKLAGLRPSSSSSAPATDVAALGEIALQLLTGRESVSVEEVRRAIGGGGGELMAMADPAAGDWPVDLATEFAHIALRCAAEAGNGSGWTAEMGMEGLKERAEAKHRKREGGGHQNDALVVDAPSSFFCPILQEVMEQPHVAADGFSYELEAIKEWFRSGHETSPMTNLKLKHTNLTPNHTLRSLITDWFNRPS